MLTLIIIILGVSFLLYTLLGGADFGAGILELFAGRRGERVISRAIAPVWEANHVWLILAVVILFTAFPAVYSSLSLVLHIPLMIVLLGIICRGSAFTFRHYDVHQQGVHKYYSALFIVSSIVTPMFLGITLGAMILGRVTFDPTAGFYEKFVAPWLNLFCVSMGMFTTCLFAYIAAVFLAIEAQTELGQARYRRLAQKGMLFTAVAAVLVFASSEASGHTLLKEFMHSGLSIACMVTACVLIPVLLYHLHKHHAVQSRIAVGAQVTAIIAGWFAIQFPVLINVKNGEHLSFYNTQAPDATLKQLLIALIVGLVLVVPAFLFLFGIFKVKKTD